MPGDIHCQPASLARKLAAILYDSVLLGALLFLAAIPPTLLNGGAIRADGSVTHIMFTLYLLTVWFLFYGWFWTHGGQTLGMAAWRIRAISCNDQVLGWRAALIRWSSACFGLANFYSVIDREHCGWHERFSATRTVQISRSAISSRSET